jgi:multiple sugar transport system substrate-binding protein
MEAPDGTLPLIGNDFFIYTNITMRETAAQLEPLTFARIRDRLDESDNPFLFGNWLSDFEFLAISVLASDGGFIDWANGKADFDNDSFIKLLEISALLPTVDELTDYFSEMSREEELLHWEAIQNGSILFYPAYINNINKLRELKAVLGDIIPTGFLTKTGGRHMIMSYGNIGISVDSANQDAAWCFVRRLLLPDAATSAYNALPLRIDRFEERIADMMTPRLAGGAEQSTAAWLGRHTRVELYAMTEDEAAEIRALVQNADVSFHNDGTVYVILTEESQLFFNGQRTAEATARIIQNRVQAYLDER